ncbi:hypothetical protein Tco_1212301 [Tanacetum coccineum]
MNELHVRLNILRLTISPEACSFMLCDLDFEPLSLSLSSMPSCDLVSLTNMLILLHYLESFKSELAERNDGAILCTDDGVVASFQQSQIHYHMLMLKLQRHTISIKIQESRIKKAQVLKTKTSANFDKQDIPLRYQVYQRRLLASFQDDARYEHVGQDTRSQVQEGSQDWRIKI